MFIARDVRWVCVRKRIRGGNIACLLFSLGQALLLGVWTSSTSHELLPDNSINDYNVRMTLLIIIIRITAMYKRISMKKTCPLNSKAT